MNDGLAALNSIADTVLAYRPDRAKQIQLKLAGRKYRFYEFFAGGGMARAGLGSHWHCEFANDFDQMKADTYAANYGARELLVRDVNHVTTADLPAGQVDLAWASFPCQDLSLAGNYAGIGHPADGEQTRSGTFWPFWKIIKGLAAEHRAPRVLVLENVYGTLTSNEGRDFAAICASLAAGGYRYGAMVIDARLFLPHSRPRVFIVGIHGDTDIPANLLRDTPSRDWHPASLLQAHGMLSNAARKRWVWWNLPMPTPHSKRFADIIEDEPTGVEWNSAAQTARLLQMMTPRNRAKVKAAQRTGQREVGGLYKRTRDGEQRAEVRFDGLAGCLRTPSGGSSRQSIIVVEGSKVRSRLLSPREAARLMGLSEGYKLPSRYNDGYRVAGDGVAVPVVRHLAKNLIEPLLES